MSIVIQKINREYSSAIELAKVYYTFITNINKIKIHDIIQNINLSFYMIIIIK